MGPNSPTSSKRAQAAERQRLALNLRIAGYTFALIGAHPEIEVTRQAAHRLVTKALDELAEQVSESARQLRTIELHRLDAMTAAIWRGAMGGDEQKIDRVLKIMARRAALLGLDAPARYDVNSSAIDEKINQELARLGVTPNAQS